MVIRENTSFHPSTIDYFDIWYCAGAGSTSIWSHTNAKQQKKTKNH